MDRVLAGKLKISILEFDSCNKPARQTVLADGVEFSGQTPAEQVPPQIASVKLKFFLQHYINLEARDLESGIDRIELWSNGKFLSEMYFADRHGGLPSSMANEAGLFFILSRPSGNFLIEGGGVIPDPIANDLVVKVYDAHGNVSEAAVPKEVSPN